MKNRHKQHLLAATLAALALAGCTSTEPGRASTTEAGFTFIATADSREFAGPDFQSSEYFMGTCEAIEAI